MKLVIVALIGFGLGLTYNNLAAKVFSPETNKAVQKIQDFKVSEK